MQFARAMRERYPEAELECWRPERSLHTPYTWHDEVYHITHRVFPSLFFRYGWELSFSLLRAARDLAKSGESFFFVHGSYNLHAYMLALILKNAPAILQSHGGLPALARLRLKPLWQKFVLAPLVLIEKYTLPRYSHIFAVNMQEMRGIEEMIPHTSVSFSPMGLDFNLFSPGERRASRKRLGLNLEAKIVLFVGRLAPEKGIGYLLEATTTLVESLPRSELYLVGSGPSETELKQRAKTLGLTEHVHFTGYIDHHTLVEWYRAADVVCLPSLFEGFPMTIAEAMACGTPVVATRAGGAEDVVREFECGRLVKPCAPKDLAQALLDSLGEGHNQTPNINRARLVLDWKAKLDCALEVFQGVR